MPSLLWSSPWVAPRPVPPCGAHAGGDWVLLGRPGVWIWGPGHGPTGSRLAPGRGWRLFVLSGGEKRRKSPGDTNCRFPAPPLLFRSAEGARALSPLETRGTRKGPMPPLGHEIHFSSSPPGPSPSRVSSRDHQPPQSLHGRSRTESGPPERARPAGDRALAATRSGPVTGPVGRGEEESQPVPRSPGIGGCAIHPVSSVDLKQICSQTTPKPTLASGRRRTRSSATSPQS